MLFFCILTAIQTVASYLLYWQYSTVKSYHINILSDPFFRLHRLYRKWPQLIKTHILSFYSQLLLNKPFEMHMSWSITKSSVYFIFFPLKFSNFEAKVMVKVLCKVPDSDRSDGILQE